jgi:chromosome segregation ATPase
LYADLENVTSEVIPTNSGAAGRDAETRSSDEFLALELEVKQLQNKIDQLVSENMMLVSALTDAEKKELATEAQIQDLGNRLNAALARAAVEERKRRNENSTKINELSDELAETKQQLKIANRSLEQEKRYHQSAKAKQKNLESQLNLARISSENNREIISTLRNDVRKLEEEKTALKSKIIDGSADKNQAADQEVRLAAALARQVQLELQLEASDNLLNSANIRERELLKELSDLQSDLASALFDLEKLREAMERQRARAEQRIAVLEDAIAQLSQPSEI